MKITFIKDCPAILDSGWSAYKEGFKADLRRSKQLVTAGYAREGWEVLPDPTPPPVKKQPRRRKVASKK